MGRSRSRSPHRERRRDRDRERHGDRERQRSERHRRSRSKSPHRSKRSSPSRNRSRRSSHTPDHDHHHQRPVHDGEVIVIDDQRPEVDEADLEGKTEEEVDMMRLMGFSGFDSTKGKKVQGNDMSATNIVHKRKYRQYMNRRGGFNRPLDFVA